MSKRRAYRATAVKNVDLNKVLESAPDGDVQIGTDIGKRELFAVVRWADGSFERPWKVKNPTEIMLLVSLVWVLAKNRTGSGKHKGSLKITKRRRRKTAIEALAH